VTIVEYVVFTVLPFWATWKFLDCGFNRFHKWHKWHKEKKRQPGEPGEPGEPELRLVGGTVHEHVQNILAKVENAEKVSS
jgi:hypothetical protein